MARIKKKETAKINASAKKFNDFASNGLTIDFKTKVARNWQFEVRLESRTIEGKEVEIPENKSVSIQRLKLDDGRRAEFEVIEGCPVRFKTDGTLLYFNDFIRQLRNMGYKCGTN